MAFLFYVGHQFGKWTVIDFSALSYPCDVKACFVAGENIFYRIFPPSSLRIIFCIVGFYPVIIARDKIIQMMTFEFVGGESMLDICPIIIEPDFFCRLPFRKEQNICFYALGIEYACRQAENGVQIKIRQQLLSYSFTCPTFKKNIVRQYYSCTASGFKHQHHVLKEVQLIIFCIHIEIRTVDIDRTCRACSEWRICKYHIYKR